MAETRLERIADGHYRLEGALTFATVSALLESDTDLFENPDDVELDLSGVDRGDSAGLALLVNWTRTARERNKPFKLVGMPDQLTAMAQVSGLMDVLPISGFSPPTSGEI